MTETIDGSTLLMVTRDGMGTAEPDLAHRLLRTYLRLLIENGTTPGAICFYAEGIRMVAQGSPVLDELRKLEERGTHLILCSTCLNHYGLAGKVAVGVVGGMPDIIAAQVKAAKVITL